MIRPRHLLCYIVFSAVLWSCKQTEPDYENANGMATCHITAGIQNEIQTYASEQGGIINVDKDTYDQRYILEVYDGDDCVYREVKITEIGDYTDFNVRLLAKKYTFAFWADFTPNNSLEDNLYVTAAGLDNITYNSGVDLNRLSDDCADAYCCIEEIDLTNSSQKISNALLKRSLGKIRFLATDTPQESTPVVATIRLYGETIPSSYNVLTATAAGSLTVNDLHFSIIPEKTSINHIETVGYLLGSLYLFADTQERTYTATVTSFADEGMATQIGERTLELPVRTNKLTTVAGGFFDR